MYTLGEKKSIRQLYKAFTKTNNCRGPQFSHSISVCTLLQHAGPSPFPSSYLTH